LQCYHSYEFSFAVKSSVAREFLQVIKALE